MPKEKLSLRGRLLFCGGGSGGHVFPLLAVQERLPLDLQQQIVWLGSRGGIERKLLEAQPYCVIPCGKLNRYLSWKTLWELVLAGSGFFYCLLLFLWQRPALLFSKGGYVALPAALAAQVLRIPVFTHESDVSPGLATRLIARAARSILLGWQESKSFFSAALQERLLVCGNPVRQQFYTIAGEVPPLTLKGEKPLLLVLGGSLGAQQLNQLVAENLHDLLKEFEVVHQHGALWSLEEQTEDYQRAYHDHNDYHPFAFIHKGMAVLMHQSNVVLCRAGAGTLAELQACNCSALLVPLLSASRGEQGLNAQVFAANHQAEILLPGKEEQLLPLLRQLRERGKKDGIQPHQQNKDASLTIATELKRYLKEINYSFYNERYINGDNMLESGTAAQRLATSLKALKQGKTIVLLDDHERENEGDLVAAAELITAETVNFFIKYGRGMFCQAITAERAKELELPLMCSENTALHNTAFTVSVDARSCPTTGISAPERALTTKVLIDPATSSDDLLRPGHCFPLVAAKGGIKERQGHTEAVVELMQLAGLKPSGVLCEIIADDGEMLRGKALETFARQHQLPMLMIADLF